MSNEFKIKKGLIVKGEGGTVVDVQGESGQLFSVTDSLTGVLLSVNDITGIPILEVSSDDTVKMGPYSNPFIVNAVGLSVGTNLVLDSNGNVKFDGTPTTTNQNRGIYWTAYDKEGTTDPSDAAYIRHTTNSGGLAGSVLEISSQNDADDGVNFLVNSTASGVRINGNAILNASNFNSYSPTLTGGGASGTWGINITGNAATITNQANSATITASTSATANTIVLRDSGADIYSRYSFSSYVNTSDNDESSITRFIIKNGDNYHRSATTTVAADIIRGVASGNWSINITGNAATVTNGVYTTGDQTIGGVKTFSTRVNIHQSGTGGGQNIFTGVEAANSDGGRAQLILSSAYSDLVIASSQANNNHGSTLSFTTYNPSNAADYRKFVINQGNWGTRDSFLDFGWANVASANPHSYINGTDTVFTLDGSNKRVGIKNINPGVELDITGVGRASGDFRAPIFYDSQDTTYYLDPNSTGKSLNIAGNIDLIARSASWAEGIRVRVPSTSTWGGIRFTRDRVGDDGNWAIGYTGIDSSDDLTFYKNNNDSGSMAARLTKGANFTVFGDIRAPIFYDSDNTAFYVDPASTSNLQGLTVTNTITGNITGNAATATTLQTARTIGGVSFNGSANIDLPGVNTSGNQNTSGNAATATEVVRTVAAGSEANLVSATIGDNDFFRIRTGGASNAGFAEIATADDGNEPIYVRQYTGTFTSLTRTATILDGSGNTSFPGNISAANLSGTNTGDQTNISGNAGTVTDGVYLSGTQTITGIKYFQSNLGGKLGSLNSPPLQAYSTGNNSAFMSFHKSGVFAVNLGLDDDNVMRIGGWSAAADRWELNMSGDNTVAGSFRAPIFYDSANTAFYVDPASTSNLQGLTVTNTITGNITGNAATITSQANSATITAATSATANTIVLRDGNGYLFGNYINMTDDGNPGAGTSISSFITKQFDNYYRSVSPTNAMVSIRGVASGDWGINITGNAASVTNGVYTTGDQTIGGTKTFSSDIIVNSLRVGRGPGNSDFNTVVGFNTLRDNTSGSVNTAIGRNAAILNQGGSSNVAVGYAAGYSNVGGSNNISIGVNTMRNNNGGLRNVAIGNLSLYTSSGNNNVTVGFRAQTYDQRTNVVVVGYNTYVTANNHTVWGNSSNNSCNCVWTSWSNVSDCRDKTDIESLSSNLGLNLIRKLRPVKFKWDNRESYVRECRFEYGQKDGTLKGNKEHYGLIAQELKQVLDELDAKFDGLGHDGEKDAYRLTYEELLAPVIKSIQEIDEKLKEVERRFDRCKL
jgi:hypothetical protein